MEPDSATDRVGRRQFIQATALVTAASAISGGTAGAAGVAAPRGPIVPLPSPSSLRADIQRMVHFGPRLTGFDGHLRFRTWLREEFTKAGLTLLACDEYRYDSWHPEHVALEVMAGDNAGPVEVAFPYVRSASTPPQGVTGRLFDAGTMPVAGLVDSVSGAAGQAAKVQAWADTLPAAEIAGSIAVVNLAAPEHLTAGIFTAISSYLHWTGHTRDDWSTIDYRRPWATNWPLLDVFEKVGVEGVVFTVDAPIEMIRGNYSPHTGRPQSVPALITDRVTGARLREQAKGRPSTRLTLLAPTRPTVVQGVTAVLPGASDEIIVVNSHSDGQNAFEENGSVALVALARHFASLPAEERLRHTLVFASWPGHMSGVEGMEDAKGWIVAHPDLVKRTAAAVTMEHLGATEWIETPEKGYHGTGENEVYAIWTTQGPMKDLALAALLKADLQRHALMKPPIQITPGAPFHDAGIPHVSGIAGPTYLLIVSDNGEMDKLNEHLAADQVGFYADVIRRIDNSSAASLRAGDPTLGAKPPTIQDTSHPVDCTAQVAAAPDAASGSGSPGSGDSGAKIAVIGGLTAALLAAGAGGRWSDFADAVRKNLLLGDRWSSPSN